MRRPKKPIVVVVVAVGAIAREKGADPVAPQKDSFFVVFTAGVGVAAFLAAVVGGIATFKKHASKKKKEEVATDEETSEPSDNLELQDKTVDQIDLTLSTHPVRYRENATIGVYLLEEKCLARVVCVIVEK